MNTFKLNDKVLIRREGMFASALSKLREGSGKVTVILQANTNYPDEYLRPFYGDKIQYLPNKIRVARYVIQRDDTKTYLIVPASLEALACLIKISNSP